MIYKNESYRYPSSGRCSAVTNRSVNAEKITQLFAYIDEHNVPVAPEKVFALEEIVAAHQYVESSAGYGKVVVRIN